MATMTASVPAVPKDVITNPHFKMWPTDTRTLVGGVLLAVCFSATMQITERIDVAISGGVLFWFGLAFVNVWFTAAVIYFGLTGGLMAANFNPIIALLTATSPLAPRFFFDNTLFVVPFALMTSYYLRKKGHIDFKTFMIMITVSMAIDIVPTIGTWLLLFHFTPLVSLGLALLTMTCVIPGGFIGYRFCRAIGRAGIVG